MEHWLSAFPAKPCPDGKARYLCIFTAATSIAKRCQKQVSEENLISSLIAGFPEAFVSWKSVWTKSIQLHFCVLAHFFPTMGLVPILKYQKTHHQVATRNTQHHPGPPMSFQGTKIWSKWLHRAWQTWRHSKIYLTWNHSKSKKQKQVHFSFLRLVRKILAFGHQKALKLMWHNSGQHRPRPHSPWDSHRYPSPCSASNACSCTLKLLNLCQSRNAFFVDLLINMGKNKSKS